MMDTFWGRHGSSIYAIPQMVSEKHIRQRSLWHHQAALKWPTMSFPIIPVDDLTTWTWVLGMFSGGKWAKENCWWFLEPESAAKYTRKEVSEEEMAHWGLRRGDKNTRRCDKTQRRTWQTQKQNNRHMMTCPFERTRAVCRVAETHFELESHWWATHWSSENE